MKNSVAVYHSLPEEARKIREEVFVREQGFQDQSYFIKTFRERTGLSPARFRKHSGLTAGEPASSIRVLEDLPS